MKKLSRLLLSTATVIGFASMASAADPELTVFDWAGFENQALQAPAGQRRPRPRMPGRGEWEES
jgi:spermidine/putrescine-binding protein